MNMEVSGKKQKSEKDSLLCKPCEGRELSNTADGYCLECKECMCRSCFDTHAQFKVGRGHKLVDTTDITEKGDLTEDLGTCNKHLNEVVKFYCQQHEECGTFKTCEDFKHWREAMNSSQEQAMMIASSIESNKKLAENIYETFAQDVQTCKDEIISLVNKLANALLEQGGDVKTEDIKNMNAIKQVNEGLMKEIATLNKTFESQTDKVNKLFVSSVLQKPRLKKIQEELDGIKGKNRINEYEFERDCNLEVIFKDGQVLGSLQQRNGYLKTEHQEEDSSLYSAQTCESIIYPKAQPLLDRQLICRNITVDGEHLSYNGANPGDVGLYVTTSNSFFEVQIISMGQRGDIVIGLVPYDYPDDRLPGWEIASVGYRAQNGMLFCENAYAKEFGPKFSEGDRIGCGYNRHNEKVVFTKNGRKIWEKKVIHGFSVRYAAIGMCSAGEKVKVLLDAQMPELWQVI